MTTRTFASRERLSTSHGMVLFGIAMMAIVFGIVASLGSPLLAVAILIAMSLVLFVFAPTMMLWAVVIGGIVIAGLAEVYVPSLKHIRWGVALAAVGLGLISLILWQLRRSPAHNLSHQQSSGTVVIWASVFVAVSIVSAAVSKGSILNSIVGLKGYFQVWGVLVAFSLLPLTTKNVDRFIGALVWIAFLQLPFALHQYFVLVPQRVSFGAGVVPADIVVGTFAGSFTGGGASPSLALLQITAAAVILGYWRIGKIGGLSALSACLAYVIPVILGEAKLVLVLIPIAMGLVFQDKLLRNPIKAFGGACALGVLLILLFFLYTLLPQAGGARQTTFEEYAQETVSYNFGEKGHGSLELNRSRVYKFWLMHHSTGGTMANTLIGYGPGVTNESTEGLASYSLARDRYRGFGIGLTALSGLLWETGVLGVLAAIGFLFSAFSRARRLLLLVQPNTVQWAHIKACQVGIAAVSVMLLHDRMFLFEIGFQTVFVVLVGYLLFSCSAASKVETP